jgi:hypothetical protein
MYFSQPVSRRALKHTRAIEIEAYRREDDLWDIEARIRDIKTSDTHLATDVRAAGTPIHDLGLRITITTDFDIVGVEAVSSAVPFPQHCGAITPDYQKLVGMNLLKQFRQQVKAALGGTQGCTHISELTQLLPTAAIQAFAGEVIRINDEQISTSSTTTGNTEVTKQQQPFQLDRCHALRLDGAAVAVFYPRWVKQPGTPQ